MSFCVTVSTGDSIVIATESRGNIFDKKNSNQTPMAYYDSEEKLFLCKKYNFAIGSTGSGLVENIFFSALAKDFISRLEGKNISVNVKDILSCFINDYVKQSYPQIMDQVSMQKLFVGGFFEGNSYLCYFNKDQNPNFGFIQGPGSIKSDKSPIGDKNYEAIDTNEAKKYAEETIKEYAKIGDRWKTIGGPIDFLEIKIGSAEWLTNYIKHNCIYLKDFISKVKNNKIILTPIAPYTKKDIDELLETVK